MQWRIQNFLDGGTDHKVGASTYHLAKHAARYKKNSKFHSSKKKINSLLFGKNKVLW